MVQLGPKVRPAIATDLDALWPLVRDFAITFQPKRDAFEASFNELCHDEAALLIVAEDENDEIVGYLLAHCHGTLLANGPVAWVEEVMVIERSRRLGLGRALMHAAELWANRASAAHVALASRRAGDFYAALDYADAATFFKKTLTISD